MEKRTLKFVTVENFIHLSGEAGDILFNFRRLIECGIVSCKNIKLIAINYNSIVGITKDAPVKIFLSNGTAVFLDLPAGYFGKGPKHLCKIIKKCFPNLPKHKIDTDILTFQENVELKYSSHDLCVYHFSCNGQYYYSM